MPGRFARLRGDLCLRGWMDVPWAVVNWTTTDEFELTRKGFYVAAACDGLTDLSSPAFLPEHHALLDALIAKGIAEPCQAEEAIQPWQRYRRADNPRLTAIHWCVTGRCNLKCRHCYMQSPSGRYGHLPFEAMLSLIEQFERANVLEVSLTGGEPFVRGDLLDLIAALVQRRIRVGQIYTNGLLLTEQILDRIAGLGASPRFQISFDGSGGHDYMRGTKGAEERTIEAIRKVRAAGFQLIVASSFDRNSIGGLRDTYDLMRGLDIQAWRVSTPIESGNWKGETTGLSLDEEADAYAQVVDWWLKDDKPFEIALGELLRAPGKGTLTIAAEQPAFHTPDSYDCASCRECPNLLPDGTLLPCPGYVDTVVQDQMPSILEVGLSKVWTESFLRTLADMKKSDLLARNEACRGCELFGRCGSGCRASAVMKTGDIMARDPVACTLWRGGYKQRFHHLAARIARTEGA